MYKYTQSMFELHEIASVGFLTLTLKCRARVVALPSTNHEGKFVTPAARADARVPAVKKIGAGSFGAAILCKVNTSGERVRC
jgi:hypothetical protein